MTLIGIANSNLWYFTDPPQGSGEKRNFRNNFEFFLARKFYFAMIQ